VKVVHRFCPVETIQVKERHGIIQSVILWTFQDGIGNSEIRASIVPRGLANRRTLPELMAWAFARHDRASRRSQIARARRYDVSERQSITDAIILHAAEKMRKRLSQTED
jgi:hypothetical protein